MDTVQQDQGVTIDTGKGIRSALERIMPHLIEHCGWNKKAATWRWKHPYDLVLDQGQEYTEIAPRPKGARWGIPKACYWNAYRYAMRYPELRYCEGYASSIYFSHAWCLTPDGRVIDPTLRQAPGPARIEYIGIPLKIEIMNAYITRTGCTGPVIEDWQGDYPLLKMDPSDFLAVSS
jgi:hypothetical protein